MEPETHEADSLMDEASYRPRTARSETDIAYDQRVLTVEHLIRHAAVWLDIVLFPLAIAGITLALSLALYALSTFAYVVSRFGSLHP
jgi:hypothetical protein